MEPAFRCLNCRRLFAVETFRCPNCGAQRCFAREARAPRALPLAAFTAVRVGRVVTGTVFDALLGSPPDRVHGVPLPDLVLLTGEPGAKKTTRALDLVSRIAVALNQPALYVSLEMGPEMLASYATRIQADVHRVHVIGELALTRDVADVAPIAVVVDSLAHAGDHAAQLATLLELRELVHTRGMFGLAIQHMTKDGDVAGRMALQHAVDTTVHLTLEEARTTKHRFGHAPSSVYF